MANPDDRAEELVSHVAQRQRNILPEDIINHDADTNDVLWHGSKGGFGIQRAGAFVIGSALILSAFACDVTLFQHGARLGLLPAMLIGGGGIRVLYKSLAGRKTEGSKQ
jgi:hypothetical protein